ncbi:MAG: sugar phosphate isomerase/epimerase [Candidatus Omnitrophota bacterium]|jgi:sugar phosphate isomerase/epimerase|nr:MAG: sugar phosphate isomerase/epimerase [Candidatus Omnitrophota bacterium]
MQRRKAIQILSSAFILPSTASLSAKSEKPDKWNMAFGLNGFASGTHKYQKNYPIWEILDFASRNGFEGIELEANWPMGGYPRTEETERIHALRRLYDGFGLQIFSIQLGVAQAFAPEAEARKAWLDEFRDRARFAQAVGCACVGMWPGGGLRGQTMDEAIDRLSASFHEAGKIAGDLDLIAAFEIEPPFVFNTEAHLKRIHAQADHPNLKIIYDPSHYDLMNGSTGKPHEMLKRIGVENIGYIHFTDADGTLRDGGTSKHLPCGDGHIDVPASLQTLYDGGFRGWFMVDPWEIPDPYDACMKAKRAVDKFFRM